MQIRRGYWPQLTNRVSNMWKKLKQLYRATFKRKRKPTQPNPWYCDSINEDM